jgi:hypothetical protein
MFVDTAAGDFRLLPCSPAIQAGLDSLYLQLGIQTDFAGNPRILDGRSDIGALESLPLSASATPWVKPACAGIDNAAVTFAVEGGCEPYTIAWTNDLGASGTDTAGLTPGAYAFTLTDQRGKTFEQALTLGEVPEILLSADITEAACGACTDGAIQTHPLAGAQPFAYLWNTGDTIASLTGLLPGDYGLTVTDAWDCEQVFNYTVGFSSRTTEPEKRLTCVVTPNPVTEEAVFRLHDGVFSNHTVRIADASGREVHRGTANGDRYVWRPAAAASGWYLWKAEDARGQKVGSGRVFVR